VHSCRSSDILVLVVVIVGNEKILCDNCLYKNYRCYACGILGSSGMSDDREVTFFSQTQLYYVANK
jgi:hypothetical protein